MRVFFLVFFLCGSYTCLNTGQAESAEKTTLSLLETYVSDLQEDIRELRGRIELLEHRAPGQLAPVASTPPAPPPPPAPTAFAPPPFVSPSATVSTDEAQATDAYNQALDLLQTNQFELAKNAFLTFEKAHPQSSFQVLARYWIGVIYFIQQNYPAALEVFENLMKTRPDSPKKYDTLLKIAKCYKAQSRTADACNTLNYLATELAKDPQSGNFKDIENQARPLAQELGCSLGRPA